MQIDETICIESKNRQSDFCFSTLSQSDRVTIRPIAASCNRWALLRCNAAMHAILLPAVKLQAILKKVSAVYAAKKRCGVFLAASRFALQCETGASQRLAGCNLRGWLGLRDKRKRLCSDSFSCAKRSLMLGINSQVQHLAYARCAYWDTHIHMRARARDARNARMGPAREIRLGGGGGGGGAPFRGDSSFSFF